jgi:SAM-dependent methyltransferase
MTGTSPAEPAPIATANTVSDPLTALQHQFPLFRIWREDACGQVRYIVRSRHPGQHPHTIVTTDPGELRAALGDRSAQPHSGGSQPGPGAPRFDPDVPHPARVYNVWLGGKDSYPADRNAAAEVAACRPQVVAGARANRAFLARAVRYLAGQCGIRQFLDVGPGLPAPDATHHVAQAIASQSKIVYVDNDPLVLAHARALLKSLPEGCCEYVDADLRDSDTIIRKAERTLDFTQPAAVILGAVLHFIPDADDPAGIVAALAAALAPGGSFVAISHLTADFAPEEVGAGVAAYNALVPAGITARSHAQVTALFGGLPLVPPGVVPVTEWRPGHAPVHGVSADLYAGVATTRRSR